MPDIEINGHKMHYLDTGSGEVILLGHSFLWDSDMWQPQIEMLSKNYRCIAPDLWGHGKSAPLNSDKTGIAELGDDYVALMDALGIEKFSIIGLSVGGMWAAHIAAKYPDRVKKLVLCGTDLGVEPFFKKLKYLLMIKMMERASSIPPKLIDKVVPIFFCKHTFENNPKLVDYFREKLASITAERIPTIAALARAIFWREDFLDEVENITSPTKIIVGAQDIARPPHESERLALIIPDASLEVIENSGHITAREQPEIVNKILVEFLK